jgi:ribose 5-phosphate isomerase B
MKIFIASDHRGFNLKEKIKEWLKEWGYQVEDMGAYKLELKDDYPDFISQAAKKISQNPQNYKGIVLGATGQGEAILANKYHGVRAIVYYGGPEKIIQLSRKHNNANVLCLGASFLNDKSAKKAIKLWLKTRFSQAERHKRRLKKIEKIEKKL